MNADTTIAIYREHDGEILGYLRREGAAWQPVTVFGGVLAGPTSREEAEHILRCDGLSSLGDIWWVQDGPDGFKQALIQEARPDRLRIRWADPLADQTPHGHWIDPRAVRVERYPPKAQ